MKHIYRFTFIVLSSFLLLGCSVTELKYRDNKLSLSFNNKQIDISGEKLSHHFDNFGSLYLLQESIKVPEGNVLQYEHVRLDDRYEFNFMTTRTIEIVFEAQRIGKVFESNGLYFYQLQLRDDEVLNLIVEQYADQSLSMIYGLTTQQMQKILQKIDAKPRRALVQNVITFQNSKEASRSRWSSKKIHFAPLIVPLRMIFGL